MLRPVVTCCAVMVLGLAAGCSSGDEGSAPVFTSEPSTASRSATPTTAPTPATPSAPVSPADLPHTTDGAITFMHFWFKAVEYAFATGHTDVIRDNSMSDCEACNSFVSRIDDQYAKGGSFRDVRIILSDVASPPLEDFGASISLQVEAPASLRISSDGAVESTAQAAPRTNTTFYVAWRDDRWKAAEIVKDAS